MVWTAANHRMPRLFGYDYSHSNLLRRRIWSRFCARLTAMLPRPSSSAPTRAATPSSSAVRPTWTRRSLSLLGNWMWKRMGNRSRSEPERQAREGSLRLALGLGMSHAGMWGIPTSCEPVFDFQPVNDLE